MTIDAHREQGPAAKTPCGMLKRGFKPITQTSVGDVPAPKFLDDKEFMSRVSARMTQAGYSESDAMRIVHADMQNDAVKLERAAVVKYLRNVAEAAFTNMHPAMALRSASECIEQEDHLK